MHITICFPLYLEELENMAKFLGTTTMVIGNNDAEFGYLLNFLLSITVSEI